jgi:hypothetical protein
MAGKYYIDLSHSPYSEAAYRDLVATLHNRRAEPPPVGGSNSEHFRRIYFASFDTQHLESDEVREKFGSLWLVGKMGHWEGRIENGVHTLCNFAGRDAVLHTRIRYSELEGEFEDLSNCKVSVRVRIEPPNDEHSGCGLIFRIDEQQENYYAFLQNAGSNVSLCVVRSGSLSFLWSQEIDDIDSNDFCTLQI